MPARRAHLVRHIVPGPAGHYPGLRAETTSQRPCRDCARPAVAQYSVSSGVAALRRHRP
jgi:hypothetical protein